MNNEWKMEEFSVLEIDKNLSSKKFVVPRYQRGVVWNDRQRADLVDTIKKGLPFGTLLLYKNDTNIYQIIDAVQIQMSRGHRRCSVCRSRAYVRKYPSEDKYFKFYGIPEREKYANDI